MGVTSTIINDVCRKLTICSICVNFFKDFVLFYNVLKIMYYIITLTTLLILLIEFLKTKIGLVVKYKI